MELALSFGWMAFVFWLILRAYGQRGLLPVLRPVAAIIRDPPNISVIVPARNEGHNLPRCLDGLLAQNYPPDRLTIIVANDNSTDNTRALAASFASGFRQLKIIDCPPLPAHWCGKPHACWTGASMSGPDDEWLCFIDADVMAGRQAIGSAIATARSQQLALLSLAPRQRLGSFAERLIIPCGLFLMAFYQDLETVQSPHSDTVTASGQFMLVCRQTYQSVGGHAAVRNAICEDLELALRIKRAGGRVLLQDGTRGDTRDDGSQRNAPALGRNSVRGPHGQLAGPDNGCTAVC
jgi:chlorobactene glucosyltransferase